MAAVPVLSAVVPLLTPVGPACFRRFCRSRLAANYFYEWGPPDFTQRVCVTVRVLLASPPCAAGARRPGDVVRPRPDRPGLPLWAVYSPRTVPVAACWWPRSPPAALQPVLGRPPRSSRGRAAPAGRRLPRSPWSSWRSPYPSTAADPPRHAAWLDDALGDLPAGTKVVDDWALGGYLHVALPAARPVMYGYGDTFTDDELDRNADIDGRPGLGRCSVADRADYAVLPPDSRWPTTSRGGGLGRAPPERRPRDAGAAGGLERGGVEPGSG